MGEFLHNRAILEQNEQQIISDIKIAVVGAGGLGGFVLNGLVRLGAKKITIIEYDKFQLSNTNRQCFCNADNIGKSKAHTLAKELNKISPSDITVIESMLTENNVDVLLKNFDIVFDCVDDIKAKLVLEEYCLKNNMPLIHGGVDKTYGQAAIIEKVAVLHSYYKNNSGSENAIIMPQIISALQLNLFVKYIKKQYQADTIFYFDSVAMEIVKIKGN